MEQTHQFQIVSAEAAPEPSSKVYRQMLQGRVSVRRTALSTLLGLKDPTADLPVSRRHQRNNATCRGTSALF